LFIKKFLYLSFDTFVIQVIRVDMIETDFFKKQTPSSEIKTKIVSDYFPKYCRIILKAPKKHKQIRYIDLFAGPGMYEDSNLSTPLLIAKSCSEDAELSQIVRLIFNDKDYCQQLTENFNKFFPPGTFKFGLSF